MAGLKGVEPVGAGLAQSTAAVLRGVAWTMTLRCSKVCVVFNVRCYFVREVTLMRSVLERGTIEGPLFECPSTSTGIVPEFLRA